MATRSSQIDLSQIDLIVIDLPGIINQGEGEAETKQLIRKYIEKEQTLILLVSEAKQDDELCTAIALTAEVDNDAVRTLRIFTKCDTFDSEEARQRVVERVRCLKRGDDACKLSPHAVVCRVKGRKAYDADGETKILKEMNLPDARAGMRSLTERLPPLFAELIRSNLPTLLNSIEAVISATRIKLHDIGEEPKGRDAMIRECQSILERCLVSKLQEPVSVHMTAFKEAIHCTEKQVTKEWSDAKLKLNVFECPFFQGAEALRACMEEITEWWRPILNTYCGNIELLSRSHVQEAMASNAPNLPATLLNAVVGVWSERCDAIFAELKRIFENRLRKEIPFGTINHYLTSKFLQNEVLPGELIDDFVKMMKDSWEAKAFDEEGVRNNLKNAKERWGISFAQRSLHEQQQQRLFHAVQAVWAVEHKTFVDYILKETIEVLMLPRGPWLSSFFGNEAILNGASEDPKVGRRRAELREVLHRMEQCKAEARALRR